MIDTTSFETFAATLVAKHDSREGTYLLDYGPEEQAHDVLKRLHKFRKTTPLVLVADMVIDLAGFGEVPVYFQSADDRYVLLSDVADQLGWALHKAHSLVRLQHGYAIEDQREADEKRGDGRLGYRYMRMWVNLDINLIMDDPEAKPDAGGGKYSDAGDWLVSHDRLALLLSYSPWGREFMDNTLPAFGHAMRKIHGDKLKDIPTVDAQGTPTGGNAYDDLFITDGLTEEEAKRRAVRGAALDDPAEDNA